MQTIAEIIAAKKATAKPPAAAPPAAQHDLELEEVINRIDPPGKRRAGLVLSAKKAHHKELRSLSETQGQAVPLTPCNASREVETWHEALNSFESQLCVMRDPADSDVVWLAIRPDREGLPPILLHRLPWILWDYPSKPTDSQPF